MSVEFNEVKYIFTGDTSSLSESTSQAIGLLDQYGNEIRKIVKDTSKMSGMGADAASATKQFKKMSSEAAKASKEASKIGSNINFDAAKRKIAALVVTLGLQIGQLKYSFDPIISKMQSLKDKASSTFPGVTKMLGSVAAAFRRAAKGADDDTSSSNRNAKASKTLTNVKNALSSATQKLNSFMSQLKKNSDGAASSFKSLTMHGYGLKSLFTVLTGYELGKMFASGIREAIHYTEVLNQFNVVMGESIVAGRKFVDQMQEVFGLDPTSIMQMTSMFYQLASAVETPAEAARQMSLGLTKASLDIASLFDVDIQKVSQDLASGMQGMTRAVRKYGIDLRMATLEQTALSLGLKLNAATTSEANRQGLRYITIMRQARAASGDFAKTIESPANQLRILKEQFRQLARAIGSFFIPILQAVLPYLNGIIMALRTIITFIAKLMGVKDISFGGATDSAIDLGSSVGGVGDAADDTTKKVKKMRKELMAPFDELNIFKEDEEPETGGGAGGGGAGGGGMGLDPAIAKAISDLDMGFENIQMKANKIRDTILEFLGFNYNVKGELEFDASQLKENLIDAFPSWTKTITAFFDNWEGIAEGFKAVWDALGNAIKAVFKGIVDGFTLMIQTLNLDEIVAGWIEELPVRLQSLADWINSHLQIFYILGQAISVVATAFAGWRIISTLLAPLTGIVTALTTMNPIVAAVVGGIAALAAGFVLAWQKSDVFKTKVLDLKEDFTDMCTALSEAWEAFWDVFGPIIKDIAKKIGNLWTEHLAPFLADVLDLIASIIEAVANIVTFLLNIFGPGLKGAFEFVTSIISTAIGVIVDVIDMIVETLDNIIDFMNAVFKRDWKKAWNAIKDAFKIPLQGILSLAVGMANGVIDVINSMITFVLSGVSKMINSVKDAVAGLLDLIGIDWKPKPVSFSYKIPHIPVPALATGGIVKDPTLAMIGEGQYDEAVIPLGDSPQLQQLVDKISEAMGNRPDDDVPIEVAMYLDGKVLYKSVQKTSRKRGVDFKMGAFER